MAFIEEKLQKLEQELAEVKVTLQKIQSKPGLIIYSVKQVASRLGISPHGVNYQIRQGNLKASGGRCKKISEVDLLVFEQFYFNK